MEKIIAVDCFYHSYVAPGFQSCRTRRFTDGKLDFEREYKCPWSLYISQDWLDRRSVQISQAYLTIYVSIWDKEKRGYYRWRAAGRVLCRSKMQQRHRVARPRVSVTVSEPDIGTYIRLVPIASQRVCLVYLLSQVLKGSITHDSKKKSPTRNMNSSLFKKGSKRPRSEAARKWDSEFRESYRENRFRTNMSPLARNPSIRFPWVATENTIPDQISQHGG